MFIRFDGKATERLRKFSEASGIRINKLVRFVVHSFFDEIGVQKIYGKV